MWTQQCFSVFAAINLKIIRTVDEMICISSVTKFLSVSLMALSKKAARWDNGVQPLVLTVRLSHLLKQVTMFSFSQEEVAYNRYIITRMNHRSFTYLLPISHICASGLTAARPSGHLFTNTPVWPVSCSQTAGEKEEWAQASRRAHQTLLPSSLLSLSFSLPSYSLLHFCTPTLLTHSVLLTFLRHIHHLSLSFSLV